MKIDCVLFRFNRITDKTLKIILNMILSKIRLNFAMYFLIK